MRLLHLIGLLDKSLEIIRLNGKLFFDNFGLLDLYGNERLSLLYLVLQFNNLELKWLHGGGDLAEAGARAEILIAELPELYLLEQALPGSCIAILKLRVLPLRLLPLALQEHLDLPHLRLVRGHDGVIPVHGDKLLGVALLLGSKQHFQAVGVFLFLEALALELPNLELDVAILLQSLVALAAHLQRLLHEAPALRSFVCDHLLEHGNLLRIGLELHLLLEADLLHRRFRVTNHAFQPHFNLGDLCKLALGTDDGQLGCLQLYGHGLDLGCELPLLRRQRLSEVGLLAHLTLQVRSILAQVFSLDGELPVLVLEILVLTLDLLKLLLYAIDEIHLPLQLDLDCPVLQVEIVELLLHLSSLLYHLGNLLFHSIHLLPQELPL
mmetsp:Transcript_102156/g.184258  ORF Transcript_102156/g.184258 Transcript_102156/m.184258 type:complete len:381 (-) Transcript_102156:1457-2599(-)